MYRCIDPWKWTKNYFKTFQFIKLYSVSSTFINKYFVVIILQYAEYNF